MTETKLEGLTDVAVIEALDEAVRNERRSTRRVLRCMIEFERRRLHEKRAYPSFFEYCTRHLGYSPDGAYKRIRAARAAGTHGELLDELEQGRIKLSAVVAISSQLTEGNRDELIEKARTLSKRELEFFIAGLAPKKPVRDCIRVEQAGSRAERATDVEPVPPMAMAGQPGKIEPVTERLARVAFTADRETVADIERACALLHARRSDLGPVFARALKALLREIDPDVRLARKRARKAVSARRTGLKRISQAVRDAVWRRDSGQGMFRDASAKRCCAITGLEFDHVVPWALGGRSDDAENIRLLCRLHNHAAARDSFDAERIEHAMEARRGSA